MSSTPDAMEVPELRQEVVAILDDTEKQDYLATMDAAKGYKANLGAAAARAKMHRDKIQAAQASQKRRATAKEAQIGSEGT